MTLPCTNSPRQFGIIRSQSLGRRVGDVVAAVVACQSRRSRPRRAETVLLRLRSGELGEPRAR